MRRILPILFALCSTFASAAPFQNGGFELGTPTADPCNIPLSAGSTAITGWTVIAGNIDWVNGCAWVPSQGTSSLDLVGSGSIGGIQQTFDTVPGRTYRVTFDMAGNPSTDFPPSVKPLTLTVPGAIHDLFFTVEGRSGTSMGWRPHARSFVATATSSTIAFVSDLDTVQPGATYAGAALDNVRVTLLNSPATTWSAIVGDVTNTGGPGGTPYPVPGSGGPVIDSHPTVVSDGTGPGPAIFTYATDNDFCCHTGHWTFQATAITAGDLTVDWTYAGYHGTCNAYATLTAFVIRAGSTIYSYPVYSAVDPCLPVVQPTDPAGGFDHQGQATFPELQPGDTYGFAIVASNYDSNGAVSGRLEVSPSAAVAGTLATPALIRALPAGSAVEPLLIGRVDGAASTQVTVRLYGGSSCIGGVLGGSVLPIGADAVVTTDASGYFGTLQGGTQGQFVAIGIVAPEVTPMSACTVSAADNDTWPKALRLAGESVTVPADWIDAPGKARWYRFSVRPGQSVQVALAGLPADYDLAVFKDIAAAFASELAPANTSQLTKLTAQFAPSAFSPSAFSPSAFSPSAFSPSAFSPSAFSPSAFSPSAFSPSAFSPSAFSPSAFSPSAFSPSAFSPSAFSPSAFSPSAFSPSAFSPSAFSSNELAQAFSSAQTRSIIAASMTPGTGNESVLVNTWNNSGDFYVRVSGRAGAFSSAPYNLAVTKTGTSCSAVNDTAISSRSAGAGGYNTIVLVDSSKTSLSIALPGGGTLGSKLASFVQRSDVRGVVVDVAADGRIGALKAQAASNVACPFAKNLVAYEIKSIVDAHLMSNPLRYVVILGGDDAIPFFRYPDQSLLGPESDFVPPVSASSASDASLRGNFVLGQDAYGATAQISLRVSEFPILGLAVGRLVETPAEIAGMLDAYVAANGSMVPGSSLVTGYDFLQDDADAVRAQLEAGIGHASDALITQNNVSPADARPYASGGPWTADDLRQKLLATRHDVVFLAGHFNANSALAANFDANASMLTTELATGNFTNALIFSAGCHSGYNIVDGDAIAGVTLPLDWAQAFARQKATLVAGTGYQYGDTDFLEYSERLYLNFARELRSGTGKVAVGEALVKAKLAYLAATPEVRGLHEKAILEATLFGLPMMGVDMPSGRGAAPVEGGVIVTAAPALGPAATLGLQVADLSVSPSLATHTRALTNFEAQPPTTSTATWLSGTGGVVTNPAEPALPLQIVNVTPIDSALVLRGVGFRGGSYADSPVVPLTGAPATELRGVHTPFASPYFYPMRLWSTNYFGALAGSGGTKLLVTPAQHQSLDLAQGTSTLRRYSGLSVRLFYSSLTSTSNPAFAKATLSDAPTIVRVDADSTAGVVTFSAQVVGDPLAAIHEVWVTYTNAAGGTDTWTSVNLQQCAAPLPAACAATQDSTYWKAQVASSTLPADTRYIVQAVNGVGLVSLDDNLGRYYAVGALAQPAPAATSIAFRPPVPTSAAYGASVSIAASLSSAGSPLAGKVVTIGAGGASRTGITDAAGNVTVALPMTSAPGSYPLTASFGGDTAYLPSSASATSSITIGKAPSALALLAAPAIGAKLSAQGAGATQPLLQETVVFALNGPGGARTLVAATDYLGQATLSAAAVGPGAYSGTASYAGSATYAPSSVALASFVIKAAQSINVPFTTNPAAPVYVPGGTFAVTAGATSGLAVTLASQSPSVCATGGANGATVTMLAPGLCSLLATQAGNASFLAAAPVTQVITIGKGNQAITFAGPGNQTFGTPPITLSANASSGLPVSFAAAGACTFAAGKLTLASTGSCTITASQAGNALWNAASDVVRIIAIDVASAWTPIAARMTTPRAHHTATRFESGPLAGWVLVAGGVDSDGKALATAELYNPATRTFTATDKLHGKSADHTATLLADGRVMVFGGGNASADFYSPVTRTWTSMGGGSNRSMHTATRLPDGRVLIVGGQDNSGKTLATTIVFNPANGGSFSNGPSMDTARERHTATLLASGPNAGKVLVVGGRYASGNAYVVPATYQLCDASSCATSKAGISARFKHGATLVTAADGTQKVLVVGGKNPSGLLATAELYDLAAGTWTGTGLGTLTPARKALAVTALPNGHVLVSGGRGKATPGAAAYPMTATDLYGPPLASAGPMGKARSWHTATPLIDAGGNVTGVLMIGGKTGTRPCPDDDEDENGVESTDTAELYGR